MRNTRIASVLLGAGLAAALSGCGTTQSSAPTTSSSYALIQEPQDGYQPIYDFMSSAKKTLDLTPPAQSWFGPRARRSDSST
jgi:hypothetical protein